MERLLYFLPERPQPVFMRYAVTAGIMVFSIALMAALELQSGFIGLFTLLPGIFLSGILFDRGSGFLATTIGALAALWIMRTGSIWLASLPLVLFVFVGLGFATVAESLRKEMEKVVAAERAKTLLIQELARRTKNNLAMLSAMVRLQSRGLAADAVGALEKTSQRIQVMAEVYDHLMVRDQTKLVDLRAYLTDITQKITASIGGENPVAVRCEADEAYVHSETAVPLAIIMNELHEQPEIRLSRRSRGTGAGAAARRQRARVFRDR